MNELNRNLRLLKDEDFIWLIYYFIITFALISNFFERKYLLNHNKTDQKKAQKITTTILIIAFFIYLYFAIVSINNYEYVKTKQNENDTRIAFERLITNLIFLVGGILAIYTDYDSNTTNTDIAIF